MQAWMTLIRAAAAAAVLLSIACGEKEQSRPSGAVESGTNAAAPQVFRINLGQPTKTLDPNLAWDITEFKVLNHLFEPLVRLDAQMQPIPGAAESWEHNADFTTWTFHLREGATWANGDPVVAGDFVFALQRILTPETKAQYAMMVYNFLEGGRAFFDGNKDAPFGARAIDDRTLEIRLVDPSPFFITLANHPSWFPLNPRVVAEGGELWWTTPEAHVGNGPYVLAEWRPKDRIVIDKSPTYFAADEVSFDRIEFLEIAEIATEIAAFETGEIDMTLQIPNREAELWMKRPEYRRLPALATSYLIFDARRPPLADPSLRRALTLSMDRAMLCSRVLRRGEAPAEGIVPHGIPLADGRDFRDAAGVAIEQDRDEALDQARAELAKAGYGPQNPPPRLEVLYRTDDINKDILEMLQARWKADLGIELVLNNTEWGTVTTRMREGDFTIARMSWYGDYLDPMTFLENFESTTIQNYGGWKNARYDELLALSRRETDPAARIAHFVEAERILVKDEAAIAPMYEHVYPVLMKTDLENIVLTPMGGLDASRGRRSAARP